MNLGIAVRRVHRNGGVERYARDLAGAWLDAGHGVTVYAESADLPEGAIWRRVPAIRWWTPRGWTALRGRHDAVVGLSRVGGSLVWRSADGSQRDWEAARGGIRWSDLRKRRAEAAAVADATRVVANSAASAEGLRRAFPGRTVDLVRNGVDGARFRPDALARARLRDEWAVPDGGRVALFLGNGFERKGLDVALAAFRRAAGPRDRMVVAGKDRRAAAAQMRATAALGESLLWLGPVDDAAPVLAAADALLLPSRFDSASNAVLEALSCGVPAVASRADGSSEIVPDPAWIVADSSDARRFGDALDRAWASGERGRDAARAAVAPWTVERNARAMLDVIAAARVA